MNKILACLAFASLLFVGVATGGVNEWTPLGLQGIDVYSLVSDPASPATLYANTSAGLLKSLDGGTSWTSLSIGVSGGVVALAIDRSDPATVYAAVNGGGSYSPSDSDGIYRSVDGGTSFTRVYVPEPSSQTLQSFGKVVALAATESGVLAAINTRYCLDGYCGFGRGGAIFRSVDRGESWEKETDSFRAKTFAVGSDGTTLYAGAEDSGSIFGGFHGGGLYRSADGGASWTRANAVPGAIPSVAIAPSNSAVAYAAISESGVYRTIDGGDTWSPVGRDAVQALAVDRGRPNVLYGAPQGWEFGALQSVDGGATWFPLGSLPRFVRSIMPNATDPTLLYAATDQGIFAFSRSPEPCVASATALCLNGGRFRVEVTWLTFDGRGGQGQALPLTPDTGSFWFRTPSDVELAIKVLDGPEPGSFWVFGGSLTDVGYAISVTDTVTGQGRGYHHAQGQPMSSFADTSAFPAGAAAQGKLETREVEDLVSAPEVETGAAYLGSTAPCDSGPTTLCLSGGRFRVEVAWQTQDGRVGPGAAVPLTADTGTFWFFDPANVELVIKVLDGRPVDGHFWVFYGALSNVAYTITVTDTQNGIVRTYANALGALSSVGDTKAF